MKDEYSTLCRKLRTSQESNDSASSPFLPTNYKQCERIIILPQQDMTWRCQLRYTFRNKKACCLCKYGLSQNAIEWILKVTHENKDRGVLQFAPRWTLQLDYTVSLTKHAITLNTLQIIFNGLCKIYNTLLITTSIHDKAEKYELRLQTFRY